MSDISGITTPQSGGEQPAPVGTTKAPDATTAGMAASGSSFSGSTKISSLQELKQKAPEVWDKTLESIGRSICSSHHRAEERRKENARKQKQDSDG